MISKACPVGNLFSFGVCEGFNSGARKTVEKVFYEKRFLTPLFPIKVEEVYLRAYESFAEARASIEKYIWVYNTKRLHSSLGYVSPATYEANYKLTSVSKTLDLVVSN